MLFSPAPRMSTAFSSPFPDLGHGLDEGSDRQIAQLRVPPHSIEAESSVLGGLLLDNGAWDRVADLVNDSDFYRYEHRLTYSAVATLVKGILRPDQPWRGRRVPTAPPGRSAGRSGS